MAGCALVGNAHCYCPGWNFFRVAVIGNVLRIFDGAEVAGRDSDVIVRGMVAKVDGGV